MKKWMLLALSAALSVCICSCGGSPATGDGQASPQLSKAPFISPTPDSEPDVSFSSDPEQEYDEIQYRGITMEVPQNWEYDLSESDNTALLMLHPNSSLFAFANVMVLQADGIGIDTSSQMTFIQSFMSSDEFENYSSLGFKKVSIPDTMAIRHEYTARVSSYNVQGVTYFIFFDDYAVYLAYCTSSDLSESSINRTISEFDHIALSLDVSGVDMSKGLISENQNGTQTTPKPDDNSNDLPPLSYTVPLGDTSVLIQNHPVSSGSGEHILDIGVGETTTDVMASITSDELSAFISALDFDTYEYQNIVLSFEDGTGLVFMKDICVVTAEYGYVNIDPYEFEMTALLGTIWNEGNGWYYMTAAEMAAADFS